MHTNLLHGISFNTGDVLVGIFYQYTPLKVPIIIILKNPSGLSSLLGICWICAILLHRLIVFDHLNLIKMQKSPFYYILPLKP